MIYYKFSTCVNEPLLDGSVHRLFQGSYDDSWFNDPKILNMVQQVEQSKFIGNGWMQSDAGVDYRVHEMSDGLQMLILAYYGISTYFKFDVLGMNLYPYLKDLFSDRDIHFLGTINPYICAATSDTKFPEIFMEDFDRLANSVETFSEMYEKWCNISPNSFVGIQQYTAFNTELETPILLEYNYNKRYKQYPAFSLGLRHKITFLQGDSASGKSYFFQTLLSLQAEFGFVNEDWFMIPLENRMHVQRLLDETRNTIVLVDVDKMSTGMESLVDLLNTPPNVLIVFAGHWFASRFRVSLDCLYNVDFSRRLHKISFDLRWLPKYHMIDSYTDIVVEDSASGKDLFLDLYNGSLVRPAGGFMRISPTLKDVEEDARVLVVLDYATAESVLPRLISMQDSRKMNILVTSSVEYYILVGLGLYNEYTSVLSYLSKIPYDKLRQLLSYVGKRVVTVETLDLIAFTLLLRKHRGLAISPGSKSSTLLELVEIDVSRVNKAIMNDLGCSIRHSEAKTKPSISYAEKSHCFGN